ncbi:4-alpha-glucanotransferase [Chlamydia psittaci]|uniref:4-alpha-glucanotransferase n=1 Tax=Chlamydia psittaci 99DC5 TaxID=1112251 RepID=A0ABN0MNJ6_CHLPS|nr:4-alpha-glucanotransferase [Chlamydia psittaci]AFS19498.1 4-alpha-glucanotransferase [Chlamydia psittaci 84/55]AFS22690.1 4-alpha-glucanotransferase [Chlamydia psittaci VS225]AGE75041.1 4-alpha-glucanotransferase [Chlamydia psittaci Mat116]EPJ15547.1 4-alpha-glucanotransferase [Chlamydia psittaci 02DC18]EPJ16742.1 4-alpha-glucanotransferase [Chlamydia psittaci 02DC22]EPJ20149.1 4-alpha-glucanotransferase [Chlamydia psittaci 02DC21]EPJ21243.1 4-alpha-glucanotransferase [Chlamydia psittaci 
MTPFSKALRYIQDSPAKHNWKPLGTMPKHGICVPLFSLHTKNSCGIGEFLDLLPLISWCQKHKLQIIQILPINDSGEDSSPYNSISSVALNPLYLSLASLPHVQSIPHAQSKLKTMQALSQLPYVHYPQVKVAKWEFLQDYYQYVVKIGALKDEEFLIFCEKEKYWLRPYTVFRSIKSYLKGAPINNWAKAYTDRTNFSKFEKQFQKECEFFSYLQFLCFQQMSQVKSYADDHQILLKGDLPILISKDSCDVWYYRQFFSSSGSAGAPPDIYNIEGQNWHLPVYHMHNLAQDNYTWWKARLRYAENFYSLYRLDHIVGFFRLWVWDSSGNGKFQPEDASEYLRQGTDILKHILRASRMLPIGEDLGSVPSDIKHTLLKLGICGTRIPRWERNWEGDGSFIPLDQYSPLSVTSLSTHDSDTLALWWRHAPKEARKFAKFLGIPFTPVLSEEDQKHILKVSHKTSSIFHINLINDYLALCPDLVSDNLKYERINIPGTVSKNNWVYRIKPSMEEIVTHDAFNAHLSEIFADL